MEPEQNQVSTGEFISNYVFLRLLPKYLLYTMFDCKGNCLAPAGNTIKSKADSRKCPE